MFRSDWICLGCILGLALVLRCVGLNAGLWYDEIVTLTQFVRLPTSELVTTYTTLNNHILYSLSAQLSIGLFDESAWALRLPAMLFGVASIGAFWFLARQVVSRGETIFSTLLMTASYHHIWFSQNARGYTGLLLCTLVATSLFLRGINGSNRRIWIAYAIVFAVAMYMHLSAVFVFASHGLVYTAIVLQRRLARNHGNKGSDWNPLLGFALGGALTMLLYAVIVPQMVGSFGDASGASNVPEVKQWKNPLWTIVETLDNFRQGGLLYSLGLPLAALLMSVGLFSLLRKKTTFALLGVVHVPLTVSVLFATSFRIWPRYFFVDGGFAILFLIHGTFTISSWLANRLQLERRFRLTGQVIGVAACIVFLLGSLFMLPKNYRIPKQDFLGARDFVESARSPGDVAASVGLASRAFDYYYAPQWEIIKTPKELDELRERGDALWLVYSFKDHTAAKYPDILARVESDFELEKIFPGTLGDGWVFVYRTK